MNSDYVYESENPPILISKNEDGTDFNKEYYEKYIKDQLYSENIYLDKGKLARLEREADILRLQLQMKEKEIEKQMKEKEIEKQKKFESDLKQIRMERHNIQTI